MGGDDLKDNCLYFDITKKERDSAVRFLLSAIIKSRESGSFPSNCYVYDEDVNVYLAHLLFAVSLPEYHEMAEPYLSTETSDVLNAVRATEDRTIRYFIFKVNADHLLIHSSIFNDLNKRPRKTIFRRSQRHFRELAKLYYDQAAAYHRRIYRKRTGVGDVLQKVTRYYDAYEELLVRVRRDYFNFLNSFRDKAFNNFMTEVQSYESDFKKKSSMDEFLDLYAQWLETRDPSVELKLKAIALEVKKLDPGFNFDLSQLNKNKENHDDRKCA